jgi:phage shock protein E
MNKRKISAITLSLLLILAITIVLSGCATTEAPNGEETPTVMNITAEQGKDMMDEDPTIVLVDVRTEAEFTEEHIPGALLVPVDELESLAPEMLPDKEATYIIYCRSGNRSATAAQQLIDMGYQNIYDMGGIIDWPYETETGL